MRKIRAALTAACMTAAAGVLLASPAHAGPNCDAKFRQFQGDGNIRAYQDLDCFGILLGVTPGDDGNWADGAGAFTGSDNDRATSLLNTGTFSGGVNNVQFWQNASFSGGTGCVAWAELYVDNLTDNRFSNGVPANDAISSHRWSAGCVNPWT